MIESASLRYMVDSDWLRQWKKHVRLTVCEEKDHPGRMDNENLLNGKIVNYVTVKLT